ncbi:MAG: sarcosine oxidase subunit gamma [Steroidobacteraceae bacterium]
MPEITELTGRASIGVKSWLPEHLSGDRAVEHEGRRLPSTVGAISPGDPRVLCLAPGDWLFVSDRLRGPQTQGGIRHRFGNESLAAVDLSDALAVIRIEGDDAREVLSKGCGLDFHVRHFPANHCARTRFAQLPLVIECREHPQAFELSVARSYCSYLRSWLLDSAAEFTAP